jgi:hypothetical protein
LDLSSGAANRKALGQKMRLRKIYPRTLFGVPVLERAFQQFQDLVEDVESTSLGELDLLRDDENWTYDSQKEFFSAFRKKFERAEYRISNYKSDMYLSVFLRNNNFTVESEVVIKTKTRESIHSLEHVFSSCMHDYHVPKPEPVSDPLINKPKIFIGHGGSPLWRDLKDHLQDH